MQTDDLIEIIKQEIVKKTNPVSIFIYGSYSSKEYLFGVSDIEIGVIKKGERSVFNILKKIASKYSNDKFNFRLYSFHLESLERQKLDSPFTDSIFIRRLTLTSKTIWGKKIIETLALPSIDIIDAYREACFSTGRVLAGLILLRKNKSKEVCEIGSKACLFATASLEHLQGEFPVTFRDIVETSKKLKLNKKHQELIDFAYNIRLCKATPKKEELYNFFYETIKYCNQIVEERIKIELKKGNKILIK